MAKAIVKVLPEAAHRLCSCHLSRNGASGTGNSAFMWTDELRESEDSDNFRTINHAPEIRATGLVAFKQSAASKFTKESFDEFRKQLDMSTTCIRENKEIAGHLELYNVRTWATMQAYAICA
ncbi:hypothetical protein LINGRAHAP2_LOCUS23006 [Linum grandiflorum]